MALNSELTGILVRLQNKQSDIEPRELRRIHILLNINGKDVNFSKLSRELGYDRETISRWYHRAIHWNGLWPEKLREALQIPGHAGPALVAERLAREIVADNPRSGAPGKFSAQQYTDIIAVALQSPEEYGRPITHWSARELAQEAENQEIATISRRQVARFLQQADLKPHRSRYWLNPKIDDREIYEQEAAVICDLYLDAKQLHDQGVHLISTDEKTGIQALERIAPTKPMKPGKYERREMEYKRHGTCCLIPSFEIATGSIINHHIGPTRTEQDFARHIEATIAPDPQAEWIFILDQLNTHMSETLVRLVATEIDYVGDLGRKDKSGILKNMQARKRFLSDESHRIRFVYTPKHCSWLNQVEIWFSILSRKVLKRGNFESLEALHSRLDEFIDYFNRTMAKAFKWTAKGLPLAA